MPANLRPVLVRLILLLLLAVVCWWSERHGSDVLWPAALLAHLVGLAILIAVVRCRPRGDVPGAVADWAALGAMATAAVATLWILWLRVLDPVLGRQIH